MRDATRPAEILLVEDNKHDELLMVEALKLAKFAVNLHRADNGDQCMAFLRKEGRYADVPTPDLIILDLKMPRMDGREVLAEIVKDDTLNHLPVVILTTSAAEQDVLQMYKLRCSSYIIKPVDFEEFLRIVKVLVDYWFTVVVRPPIQDRSTE